MSSPLIPEFDFTDSPSSFVDASTFDSESDLRDYDEWTNASSLSSAGTLSKYSSLTSSLHFKPLEGIVVEPRSEVATKDFQSVVCESPQRHVRKRLVKRSRMQPLSKTDSNSKYSIAHDEPVGTQYFSCEIDASNGMTYRKVEALCQRLVTGAGGTLLNNEFIHPGGFLYELPVNRVNPLLNGTEVLIGGKIAVTLWACFSGPRFNHHRSHACCGPARDIAKQVSGSSSVEDGQPQRTHTSDSRKSRISTWLGGRVKVRGGETDDFQPAVAAGM